MKIALICLGLIALVAADGHGHGARGRAVGHRAARAGHRAAPARSVNRRTKGRKGKAGRRGRQEAEAGYAAPEEASGAAADAYGAPAEAGSGSGADDAYGAPPAEEYGAPAAEGSGSGSGEAPVEASGEYGAPQLRNTEPLPLKPQGLAK